MRLTIVGCAPAYTSHSGRASSCYLVEHGDTAIVLDMGQGAFAELWRYRSPGSVTAVAISHLHADHCVDLVPLRHFSKYEAGGVGPALYGPAELGHRFDSFQAESEFLSVLRPQILEPGMFAVGDLTIETRRVTHIPDSFAFRIAPAGPDTPSLVYSGDCGNSDDLAPLVRAGDTLLCEAAFGDDVPISGLHINAAQAGEVAASGGARRLILTHILDRYAPDRARAAAEKRYSGEVVLAEPELTISVS
jgi:ribonuclease BN (tRNA processing enzyme)